jgi:predicted nucleic acid-binding protein
MVDHPTYIDSNIFVYWLGDHPKFGKVAYKWIKEIENSQRGKYATSSLTLYETLVIVAGLAGRTLKDKPFTQEVINSMTKIKGLSIETLMCEDFTKATNLMSEYKLDFEDSIHLAVALRIGAQEIISNDKDFDQTPVKRSI